MLLNCSVAEDSWESLGLQGDPTSPSYKGNQSWIFIGRTDAETEAPILWPPDVKSWHIRKDPDVGKDWRPKEMGTTEDEMVGWHHQLYGHEFEQALGVSDEQESLACWRLWDRRVGHNWATEQQHSVRDQVCSHIIIIVLWKYFWEKGTLPLKIVSNSISTFLR